MTLVRRNRTIRQSLILRRIVACHIFFDIE